MITQTLGRQKFLMAAKIKDKQIEDFANIGEYVNYVMTEFNLTAKDVSNIVTAKEIDLNGKRLAIDDSSVRNIRKGLWNERSFGTDILIALSIGLNVPIENLLKVLKVIEQVELTGNFKTLQSVYDDANEGAQERFDSMSRMAEYYLRGHRKDLSPPADILETTPSFGEDN